MKNESGTKTKIALLTFMAILIAGFSAIAQETKSSLFKEADRVMQNAKSIKADILSPMEYAKALNYYNEAAKDFNNKNGIEKIEANLMEATNYFKQAIDFSYSARIVFANSLNARNDALSAEADLYAKELWVEAEEQFIYAAEQLEKGDRDDSYEASVKAIETYRKSELSAIKTNLLDETRNLLLKADDLKVDKRAPKTLKNAKLLLAETEKELETNRYDMDYPRILAKQAKYEAKHAIYLNNAISKANENNTTLEEMMLKSEIPFIKIAETIGFVAEFDEGSKFTENEIVNYILLLQKLNENLYAEIAKKDNLIDDLVANVNVLNKMSIAMNAEFEKEIGKRTKEMKSNMQAFELEKSKLAEKVEYQEQINEKFDNLYKIFKSTEAKVLRSGNDVIIRMDGFGFESGKSEIKPENYDLLTKVQTAIKTFPKCQIVVEGYTDSFGGDSLNLKLSQERSDAVTEYLKANMMALNNMNISSVGQGENNPVANNETAEGRRKNRRIDILIKPTF
jgi:outer membrane protein OmpA-like peptidoglycan-associated protein/HEPN domain-containing protein